MIGEVQYELRYTTETGMLKLFAFLTRLIRILGRGLQTFKLARYRQLNKRIGRLIRLYLQLHCVCCNFLFYSQILMAKDCGCVC